MNADLLLLGGALLSGLMGSAHCALMCGGIATGFSATRDATPRSAGLRHWNRTWAASFGYALAGAIAGGIGHGIVSAAQLPALVAGGARRRRRRAHHRRAATVRSQGPSGLPAGAGLHLDPLAFTAAEAHCPRADTWVGWPVECYWGWLPCGLSATVLLAAWLQSSAVHGALLMLAFGAGTLPAMVPLTWSGARLGQRLQQGPARMALATLILVAGLVTVLAPWLAGVPHLHAALRALVSCRSIS